MQTNPLVSIIIPLRNRADLIRSTLASACRQSYPWLEIIVIDDGSTDSAPDLVRAWAANDPRVSLSVREDSVPGAPSCRNQGLLESHGEFVVFLDSDDLFATNAIERRLSVLMPNKALDAVVAQGLLFRERPGDGQTLWNRCEFDNDDLISRFLDQDIPWQTTAPLWRRQALNGLSWDRDLESFQDWEFHIRACFLGRRFEVLPYPDYYIRRSAEAPRISRSYFENRHVTARALAFRKVCDLMLAHEGQNRRYARGRKGFVIRNLLQLVEHSRNETFELFYKSTKAAECLSVLDGQVLKWMRQAGVSWRYDRLAASAASLCWGHLAYDSHRIAAISTHSWLGSMPPISIDSANDPALNGVD